MKRLMFVMFTLAACAFAFGKEASAGGVCDVCGDTHECTASVRFFDSRDTADNSHAVTISYNNCTPVSEALYDLNSKVAFKPYITKAKNVFDRVTLTTEKPHSKFTITYDLNDIRRDWQDKFESTLVND